MHREVKTIALMTALILSLAAGCAEKKDLNTPNLPPETYIAVGDSIRNPTVYMQKVSWWGDDKDGEVIGFEYRWSTDPSEPCCSMDTSWVYTESTSEEFNLPVTSGIRKHTIRVRAVDDQGAVDPEPAQAVFPVTNNPPTVKIWDKADLPDTTLPAILIKWHGDDPDGPETIETYKVWLDGSEDDAILLAATDTVASIGFDSFEGRYGQRTLNLVAIDSGCDTSNVVSHTWYVVEPSGNVLLVDDLSREDYTFPETSDRFYRGALDQCVDTYSILDVGEFGGIGYAYNMEELFTLFDLVIWYNEPLRTATPGLEAADQAFRSYLGQGGRVIIVSMAAVGTNGALLDSTAFETFGIDTLYTRNGETNFDCKRWTIQANADLGLDSLKVSGFYLGVECMRPVAQAVPLYYIPPGIVSTAQTVDYYLGIMHPWQGGKAALITFPVSRADSFGNARREFCKLIDLMLE
jgi:hypothetical protein